MMWLLWTLAGILCLALLAVCLGAAYLYRFALSRKPFPNSYVKPDPWETEPAPRKADDGSPYDPCGWGERIREADLWLYAAMKEKGTAYTMTSYDGLKLRGQYLPPEAGAAPRGIILMVHGYRSSAMWDFAVAARDMHADGFGCFMIDQRAHGGSEGKTICYGVKERYDVRDWAALIEREYPGVPVILDGISMGSATVMAAAALDLPQNVRGIIADCGYTSMEDMFNKSIREWFHLPTWPLVPLSGLYSRILNGFDFHDVKSADSLRRTKVPVLLAHGEADTFVPYRMGREIWEKVKDTGMVTFLSVPEAEHGLAYITDRGAYRRALDAFFARCGIAEQKT